MVSRYNVVVNLLGVRIMKVTGLSRTLSVLRILVDSCQWLEGSGEPGEQLMRMRRKKKVVNPPYSKRADSILISV